MEYIEPKYLKILNVVLNHVDKWYPAYWIINIVILIYYSNYIMNSIDAIVVGLFVASWWTGLPIVLDILYKILTNTEKRMQNINDDKNN